MLVEIETRVKTLIKVDPNFNDKPVLWVCEKIRLQRDTDKQGISKEMVETAK